MVPIWLKNNIHIYIYGLSTATHASKLEPFCFREHFSRYIKWPLFIVRSFLVVSKNHEVTFFIVTSGKLIPMMIQNVTLYRSGPGTWYIGHFIELHKHNKITSLYTIVSSVELVPDILYYIITVGICHIEPGWSLANSLSDVDYLLTHWVEWCIFASIIKPLLVQINNIPALVETMAWCESGNKPLSQPMLEYC